MNGLGRLYLIDTSALARVHRREIRKIVFGLIADGVAATSVTVDLEIGYTAKDAAELRDVRSRRRELYQVLPVREVDAQRARDVQLRMANRGLHRAAGAVDLLTAAIAERHGATILHYDRDFEHIASVTGQSHVWIVPPGSID